MQKYTPGMRTGKELTPGMQIHRKEMYSKHKNTGKPMHVKVSNK